MKKTIRIKAISFVLIILTLIQLLGMGGVSAAENPDNTPISIPDGHQAIYTANISRTISDRVSFQLGNTDVFSLSSGVMKLCNSIVQGKYVAGDYALKICVNPTQQMVFVEVTLPDGGVVRRGVSDIVNYSSIVISKSKNAVVSDVKVIYEKISVANYILVETEPADTVFGKNVIIL